MSNTLFPNERAVIGKEIDGFRIEDVLGRGGMGIVYRAEELMLGRQVALKVIDPDLVRNEEILRRFQAEARVLAQLSHPNIVLAYALRQTDLGLYIVMEYVEGKSLAQHLRANGPMTWDEALPLVRQMLSGFAYAHEHGIVHRDIKPNNIMLTPDGQIKIMDFGLAKVLREDGGGMTRTMTRGGTLYYMSPEQVKSLKHVDHRTDLYSLGMSIYQMLSGRLPFSKKDSEFTILKNIVEANFPPPRSPHAALPAHVSSAIMRSLEKNPDDRFADARDMLDAFERPAPPKQKPEPPPRKQSESVPETTVVSSTPFRVPRPRSFSKESSAEFVPERRSTRAAQRRAEKQRETRMLYTALIIGVVVLVALVIVLIMMLL